MGITINNAKIRKIHIGDNYEPDICFVRIEKSDGTKILSKPLEKITRFTVGNYPVKLIENGTNYSVKNLSEFSVPNTHISETYIIGLAESGESHFISGVIYKPKYMFQGHINTTYDLEVSFSTANPHSHLEILLERDPDSSVYRLIYGQSGKLITSTYTFADGHYQNIGIKFILYRNNLSSASSLDLKNQGQWSLLLTLVAQYSDPNGGEWVDLSPSGLYKTPIFVEKILDQSSEPSGYFNAYFGGNSYDGAIKLSLTSVSYNS